MFDPASFRILPGHELDLSRVDPDSKAGFSGDKDEGKGALNRLTSRLAELQRRLWGEGSRSLLVVLQAMDTGGKDGTIRHVFRGVNPQGVHVRGFGPPSEWEQAHDFLWRVHLHTPENGAITIFNRSHYEDVLAARVRGLVPEERWRRRFRQIVDFERMLVDEGTTIVKVFLHISPDEQRKRLQERLEDPEKRWKFSMGDLEDRSFWADYQQAYEEAIVATTTAQAPWFVIPANRKWYRNLAVSTILIDTLEEMNPRYPEPSPDLDDIVIP